MRNVNGVRVNRQVADSRTGCSRSSQGVTSLSLHDPVAVREASCELRLEYFAALKPIRSKNTVT
jgi:hypothetical protein